jgi:DNA mismatch repair protein MutL
MSSKIRVLDEQTINKIAAGEVIENPASVVKELVENAIDAKASEIAVEIKEGGRQLIRVTDNGCGMCRDDALLCLERHATSKIRDIDDIHSLTTMGFRGEAVPAIASISKLSLLTCEAEGKAGTLLIVDGGRLIDCSPAARSQGSTFEIKSLFFNVPVRKKFQRSPSYDANEILKVVSIQALANPTVKFQLISNQKSILTTKNPKSSVAIEQIKERISDVLGMEFSHGLAPLEREHNGYKLMGYFGLPSHSRQNRTGQYLFINQRAVLSPLVSYAVKDAYSTTLGANRHPVFVLYLTMQGDVVDVNVHPQKREVRLRQENTLRQFITLAVEEALQGIGIQIFSSPTFYEPPVFLAKSVSQEPIEEVNHRFDKQELRSKTTSYYQEIPLSSEIESYQPKQLLIAEIEDNLQYADRKVPFPTSFKVIAALQQYLILYSPEGKLQLLDQSSAHSRILYEQLLQKEEGKIAMQQLLIPITLELAPLEASLLKGNLDLINGLGIQIQDFGKNSFIIHAISPFFDNTDIADVILKILSDMEGCHTMESELQKNICRTASRAALSKNKILTLAEGQHLYHQLMKCRHPFHCPHGTPTIVEMHKEDIAKQFQN